MSLGFVERNFPGRFFLIEKPMFLNTECLYSHTRAVIAHALLGTSVLERGQSIGMFFRAQAEKAKSERNTTELPFVFLLLRLLVNIICKSSSLML